LRKQGFRAHHCHKIERRAREVVKAVRNQHLALLTEEIIGEVTEIYTSIKGGSKKLSRYELGVIHVLARKIARYQLELMIENKEFRVSRT